jgi:muconate cycloisomerase
VHTPRDVIRVLKEGAADVIKIKIAKCGGYRRAAEIVSICANEGVEVVVGNGVGTSAASLHELCFVASRPEVHTAGEFPGPDKLKLDILQRPFVIENGDAVLPTGPGIGSDIDEEAFAALRCDIDGLPL